MFDKYSIITVELINHYYSLLSKTWSFINGSPKSAKISLKSDSLENNLIISFYYVIYSFLL